MYQLDSEFFHSLNRHYGRKPESSSGWRLIGKDYERREAARKFIVQIGPSRISIQSFTNNLLAGPDTRWSFGSDGQLQDTKQSESDTQRSFIDRDTIGLLLFSLLESLRETS